ncbi:MAG: hypothetical protein F6J98_15240 [Moorea sp. SIO4G2]|nr:MULTISPECIES: hypothetical protein [unclassified Moorena]NEO15571.1 hypothetical protein [Moorena sp. SIO3E8]NEO61712.1 hypothetical protein [Moorena sp. SIO4G2]NEP98998.1 hypothetical protein [Moorena sp. SIO3F7]
MQSLMGETTAVAHGGDHGSRSWGKPPRPRCLPKTAPGCLTQVAQSLQ